MLWEATEKQQASVLGTTLSGLPLSSDRRPRSSELHFSADTIGDLMDGLYHPPFTTGPDSTYVNLPVRHLYRLLGFSESHPFRLELDHKLVHLQVLNYFCEGCVPVTCGLSKYLDGDRNLSQDAFNSRVAGASLKRSRGYVEESRRDSDLKEALGSVSNSASGNRKLMDEEWVIQEALPIKQQYRVHTIEDSVIDELTYFLRSTRRIQKERSSVNSFVRGVLKHLPKSVTEHSICGWDVVELSAGDYRIAELHFSGFHPVIDRGFHSSAVLARPIWGPYNIAKLFRFCEKKYRVKVSFGSFRDVNAEIQLLYGWISRWFDLLGICYAIQDSALLPDEAIDQDGVASKPSPYQSAEDLFKSIVQRFRNAADLLA